ncbi:MAG: hypothetical protein WC671_02705 [Candidatus Paceibacterota bacterium]
MKTEIGNWVRLDDDQMQIAENQNNIEGSLCPDCKKKDEEIEEIILNEGLMGLA